MWGKRACRSQAQRAQQSSSKCGQWGWDGAENRRPVFRRQNGPLSMKGAGAHRQKCGTRIHYSGFIQVKNFGDALFPRNGETRNPAWMSWVFASRLRCLRCFANLLLSLYNCRLKNVICHIPKVVSGRDCDGPQEKRQWLSFFEEGFSSETT